MSQDPSLPKYEIPLSEKAGATSKNWYFFFQGLLNSLGGGVTQLIAGTNVTLSPTSGVGAVTVNATGGGGGSGTVTSVNISSTNLTVGGGPVTTAGTLTVDLTPTQVTNIALGGTSLQAGAVQFVESAGWNSTSGAISVALTVPQDIVIPYACTLKEVYILTQGGTGSCTVDVWKVAIGAFPPSGANDITGGVPPAIASNIIYTNTTLTGWTASFAQSDVIRFTLASNSVFTSVKIVLRMG